MLSLPAVWSELAPLDLRFVGRTLLHTLLVGLAAGFIGAAFFWALESMSTLCLEDLAGYVPLRAHGEAMAAGVSHEPTSFRPWLLLFLPALGGLLCGFIGRYAPEVRGGGADATIEAFHHGGGFIRRRVLWTKPLASLFTLGTGGAGGREGPTMHIGGAIGSMVGRLLGLPSRERRILLVAGIAAGIAAVFRTPLGAALLAVEVLYRDDFESDALVPAIFASVIAYSVVISLFGESVLLAHAPRYPFTPSHLPLYGLLAVLIAVMGHLSLGVFSGIKKLMRRLPGPEWLRPAWGGLILSALATPIIMIVGDMLGTPGSGLGLLGGGYGAVQVAITGATWIHPGWEGAGLLLLLAVAKLFASALTIGSGGSAGDFAPSLAIGGLLGGAFGRAAQVLIDPGSDPGAFALVGMGAFSGGIAHVPLSALVLVCELAGSYDLLVPLMLALGVSLIGMRKRTLYEAQVPTQRDSAVHKEAPLLSALETTPVGEVMQVVPRFATFTAWTSATDMLRALAENSWQDTFPVLGDGGEITGLVKADALRGLATDPEKAASANATDVLEGPVSVHPEENLRTAAERLMRHQLRELPVVDGGGHIVGFLDEDHITQRYLGTLTKVAGPRHHTTIIRKLPPQLAALRKKVEGAEPSPPEPPRSTTEPDAPPVAEAAPSRLFGAARAAAPPSPEAPEAAPTVEVSPDLSSADEAAGAPDRARSSEP
ncbi:MAG: chloride channel protein [Myxococcota bacterium]